MNHNLQVLADELDELDETNEVFVHVHQNNKKPAQKNRHIEHRAESRQVAKETEHNLDALISFYKREAKS